MDPPAAAHRPARRGRARRRRQLPGRHRSDRRRPGGGRSPGARAAPGQQGRSRRGVPARLRPRARGRLRRDRRDGRRRLAPARAAAPAARRDRGDRRRTCRGPGDRVPLGAGRHGGELAATPRGALARRQPLRPRAAGHLGQGRHRRLPALPPRRAGEAGAGERPLHRLRLPDRHGRARAAGGTHGPRGPDRVRGAGARRFQDEWQGGGGVAAPEWGLRERREQVRRLWSRRSAQEEWSR